MFAGIGSVRLVLVRKWFQDILTGLFGDKALVLDSRVYNMTDRLFVRCAALPAERLTLDWVRQNTVVVHYLGKPKPWQKNYIGPLGVFYREEAALTEQTEQQT